MEVEGCSMKIKYAGPKTLISTSGISFDKRKRDKFIYLDCVLQLMEAIDHDYVGTDPHPHTTESRELIGEEILERVRQHCPDIETIITQARQDAEAYMENNLTRAENSPFLNDEEVRTLINNLNIMHEYTVQRFINKYTYYYIVKKFIERLRHSKIKYISAPAYKTYFHVFHTIKRGLRQQKNAVQSELIYHVENEHLFIKLNVLSS